MNIPSETLFYLFSPETPLYATPCHAILRIMYDMYDNGFRWISCLSLVMSSVMTLL